MSDRIAWNVDAVASERPDRLDVVEIEFDESLVAGYLEGSRERDRRDLDRPRFDVADDSDFEADERERDLTRPVALPVDTAREYAVDIAEGPSEVVEVVDPSTL